MPRKRIILSAGGTGGHLFPAQVVAQQLAPHAETLFVGGRLEDSPFFDQTLPFREIPSATFSFSKPLTVLKGSRKLLQGYRQSQQILKTFQPDLVVGFGSFFTLPMLLAAKAARIPIVLHEQNAIPGKINRLFSRFATVTAVTFPSSKTYLKGPTTLVDFPVRPLPPKALTTPPTLLIMGGSQGAEALNALVIEALPKLSLPVQVCHLTGNPSMSALAKATYAKCQIPHVVKEFDPQIPKYWGRASLAICRAGAGTIAELLASETPAILIPFPFATADHQTHNAQFFAQEVGGGVVVQQEELTADLLIHHISSMLNKAHFAEQIRQFKMRSSYQNFLEVLLKLC